MEPRDESRPDSLSLLAAMAAEERTGTKRMRLALVAAVGLHVVLFAIQWPSFAVGEAEAEVVKPRIFVIENHLIKPPDIRPFEPPPLPRRTIVVPDATPDDPEPPLRPPEVFAVPPVDIGDMVLEVPDPPPDPESTTVGPVWAHREVEPPAKVFGPDPVYPKAAVAVRLQGYVVLECLIDREGRVADVKVLRAGQLGMTEAAVDAVRQWRFEPSTVNEEPVEVLYILTVRFTLPRS